MDRVLITMPKTTYEFLQALAVVQDYQLQLAVGAQRKLREINYQVSIRMSPEFKYLEPCLRVVHENVPIVDYSGWNEQQRGEYDCFIKFDEDMFKRAKALCDVTCLNITAGLNSLIGAGASYCPVLNALQLKPIHSCEVLVLDWDEQQTTLLQSFIVSNNNIGVIIDPRDLTKFPVKDIIEFVNEFDAVIGRAGVITYTAVTLKKAVIEIFKSNAAGLLNGAIGNPMYAAVVAENVMSASFVWNVWSETIWPLLGVSLNTNNQEKHNQMVVQESTVDNAVEK